MRDIVEKAEHIEDLILMAMHANQDLWNKNKSVDRVGKGISRKYDEIGIYCNVGPQYPSEMITMDMQDETRLFANDISQILIDPRISIGEGLETCALTARKEIVWTKFMPMKKPKNLIAITNSPTDWYSFHYREWDESGKNEYIVKPIAIAGGKPVLIKPMGSNGYNSKKERDEAEAQLVLSLSVYEDAIRSNAYLATVSEGVKLSFPIGELAYKEFFAMRDGHKNTPTGQRNPILHWCSKHIRSRGDKVFEVKNHKKGTHEMVHGNLKLQIKSNVGYGDFMQASPELAPD